MLDALMHRRRLPTREVLLPPLGVTARQSTDVLAVEDPDLRDALRYIREHADEGIDVRAVLNAVPMARRTLERRCREVTGRTPAGEIRRRKLEKVRRLLTMTDIPIPEISAMSGFNYVEHMIPAFKRAYGCTPSAYRQRTGRDAPA